MWSNRWQSWLVTIVVGLAGISGLWWVNSALSQGTTPGQLSYQGRLLQDGQPVNGSRDMVFRLYTDALCTTQAGAAIVRNGVALDNGLFTIYLDVNPAFFDGQALWIQPEVEGTVLGCQPLSAAPYALGLRPGAVIRGATSSANGLLELENSGPGQAVRITSSDGMALYGNTAGGPAIYGYAAGGYGVRGVSSASGSAAVRGDTSTENTLGGEFYSKMSSGVSGATASVVATPIPGVGDTYVAGVRGVAQSGGHVYGVYAESSAGISGAGVYAANSGPGDYAPDAELGGGSNGNGVLASDQGVGQSSSNLVLLSNDDILLFLNSDRSLETSSFEVRNRDNGLADGNTVFSVGDNGDAVAEGTITGENGLLTGAASGDGVFVYGAGGYPSSATSGLNNGVEVRSAANDGLFVGATGGDGVEVYQSAGRGLYVRDAGTHGVYVGDTSADNYLAGDTGIGHSTPDNRLEVRESVSGSAASSNHVVQIYNTSSGGSADVLALRINEAAGDIGSANNYITFHDAAGSSSLGAIEGNGSGGVLLTAPGNDYAEYLPRIDVSEQIAPGDVVGVFGGRISKRTAGADQVMVASTGSIVAGADPGEEARAAYTLVAFVGQVDIRVEGPVAAGDLLVPSGRGDGLALAIAPESLTFAQLGQMIGQAWESDGTAGPKQVRALVGLVQPGAVSTVLGQMDARLEALERQLGSTDIAPTGGQTETP